MIIDQFENAKSYCYGPAWEKVFDFLKTLTPDSEAKEYSIQGEDIFARVFRYETKTPDKAVLESHRVYADIQTVIEGEEILEYFQRDDLTVSTPYDEADDAELYKRDSEGQGKIRLIPGTFAALFPKDAHMPSLQIDGCTKPVFKVVVKVKMDLLTPGS